MDRSQVTLRIGMNQRWNADELGRALLDIAALYDVRLALALMQEDRQELEMFWEEMLHFPPLRRMWKRRGLPPPFGWPGPFYGQVPQPEFEALVRLVQPDERLRVERISYASPGATDLAGFAGVVGHIKDFILRIVEFWGGREQRRLQNQRLEIENERMRLDNARQFVAFASELGYSQTEVRSLVLQVDQRQEGLIHLAASGKLEKVALLERQGDEAEE